MSLAIALAIIVSQKIKIYGGWVTFNAQSLVRILIFIEKKQVHRCKQGYPYQMTVIVKSVFTDQFQSVSSIWKELTMWSYLALILALSAQLIQGEFEALGIVLKPQLQILP